jgi:hypothetical protein
MPAPSDHSPGAARSRLTETIPAERERSMSITLEGGCLCGAVRYRLAEAPSEANICHCATCRRAAGAPSVAWATLPAAGFAWIAGRPVEHASSTGVTRTHCAACGTSLTYQARPDSIDVTIASLDDPEAVPPTTEIWLSHRLSWEPVDPGRVSYPGGS